MDTGDVVPAFFEYLVVILLCGQAGASLGYILSAAARSVHSAASAGPVAVLPLIMKKLR